MARARWHLTPPGLGRSDHPLVTHDAAGPLVRLQTLGATTIDVGRTQVDPSAGMLFALLVRLAYAPGHSVARDALLSCVWSEHSELRRGANLRQALYKLRQMGVRAGLVGELVTLDAEQIAPTFSLTRTADRFEADVTRGTEPFGLFLPGYATGRREFDEWLAGVRDAVHADVRRVLVAQLRARRERADWMGADAMARWLLQFDPLNEDATLTYAECTARNGSKAEALAIIDRYLAEVGPSAGDIRVPATVLRRRIGETQTRPRRRLAPSDRHFVGREELMASLTLSMRRARWHDGSATLLHGVAGIGKTRVAQELAKVATLEGFRVLTVECRGADTHRPLSVFVDLVPTLLELPGAMGCDPDKLKLLRQLNQVVNAGSQNSASESKESGSTGFLELAQVRTAIVEMLYSVAFERPMLLILEDVEELDGHSRNLVEMLYSTHPNNNISILMTAEKLSGVSNVLRRDHRVTTRPVEPLTPDFVSELVNRARSDLDLDVSSHTARWLVQNSDGNPLYFTLLLNHWIETGSTEELPDQVASLVDHRLSELPADARRLIQVIALLGKLAEPQLVGEVLQLPAHRLFAAIEVLTIGAMMDEGAGGTLRVQRTIEQRAVTQMGESMRRVMHRRIASVLKRRAPFRSSESASHIIEHLIQSRQYVELATFAGRAADAFTKRGDTLGTIAVTERAAAAIEDRTLRLPISQRLVAALYASGAHYRVSQVAARDNTVGLAEFDESNPEYALTLIENCRHQHFEDYFDLTARAVAIARSPRIASHLRVNAATLALRTALIVDAKELARQAYEIGCTVVEGGRLGSWRSNELQMYYATGFGDSARGLNAAIALAEWAWTIPESKQRLSDHGSCAYAMRVNGAPRMATELYESVFERSNSNKMPTLGALAAWNLSLIALDHDGDLELARHWVFEGQRIAETSQNEVSARVLRENSARIAIERRDIDALDALEPIINAHRHSATVPCRHAYALAMMLGIARVREELNRVRELLTEAQSLFAVTKKTIGQDYLAHQLALAIDMTHGREASQAFIADYLLDRRVGALLPTYLSSLARRD